MGTGGTVAELEVLETDNALEIGNSKNAMIERENISNTMGGDWREPVCAASVPFHFFYI